MIMKRRLLLLSNSTNPGEPYLGWPRKYLSDFMSGSGVKDILFVPYAGVGLSNISLEKSYDVYEQRVQAVFGDLGLHIRSVHHCDDPISAINDAGAIAVGGGNTFHLVYMMHKLNIMKAIRERVLKGISFIGWSAGSNVACPTLRTTNDMPIIQPESFDCLNLIPFQINPHYLDVSPAKQMGVFMGLFNMSITIPQIVNGIFGGIILKYAFNGDPIKSLYMAGVLLLIGGVSTFFVKDKINV
jgi:dipeptidase E